MQIKLRKNIIERNSFFLLFSRIAQFSSDLFFFSCFSFSIICTISFFSVFKLFHFFLRFFLPKQNNHTIKNIYKIMRKHWLNSIINTHFHIFIFIWIWYGCTCTVWNVVYAKLYASICMQMWGCSFVLFKCIVWKRRLN